MTVGFSLSMLLLSIYLSAHAIYGRCYRFGGFQSRRRIATHGFRLSSFHTSGIIIPVFTSSRLRLLIKKCSRLRLGLRFRFKLGPITVHIVRGSIRAPAAVPFAAVHQGCLREGVEICDRSYRAHTGRFIEVSIRAQNRNSCST